MNGWFTVNPRLSRQSSLKARREKRGHTSSFRAAKPSIAALTTMSTPCMAMSDQYPNPYQASGIATRKFEIVKLKSGRIATLLTRMLRASSASDSTPNAPKGVNQARTFRICVSSGICKSSAIRGAATHIPAAARSATKRAQKNAVATWSGRTTLR
jgi:hypothetical protein